MHSTDQTWRDAQRSKPEHPHRNRPRARKSRRGAALMELLLVIGVVAVFIIGALALYGRVMDGLRNQQLGTLISRMAARVDAAYANYGNYDSGDLLPVLFASGQFSTDEVNRTGNTFSAFSPYDTAITVVGDGARNFTITVNDLEDQACTSLLEKLLGETMQIDATTVNGTAVTLAPQAVATACTAATNNQYDVAVTF